MRRKVSLTIFFFFCCFVTKNNTLSLSLSLSLRHHNPTSCHHATIWIAKVTSPTLYPPDHCHPVHVKSDAVTVAYGCGSWFWIKVYEREGGAETRRVVLEREETLKRAMGHVNSFFTYLLSQFTEKQWYQNNIKIVKRVILKKWTKEWQPYRKH